MHTPKLSVVVPVFNERATIEEVVRRPRAVDIEEELVVVDAISTDGRREPPAARVLLAK